MSTPFKLAFLFVPLLWLSVTVNAPAASASMNEGVKYQLYQDECASCHMAYPAWLLPARSWQKIMANLDNHFGDNATLDPASLQTLTQYLLDNSADTSHARRGRKILRSIPRDNTPLRISKLPYIQRKHREIPARFFNSPDVNGLSNCAACHQGAVRGYFDDDSVRIPGYGHWDG